MIRDQFILDLNGEIIVDNFAGGGGASHGIEDGLGRHVDIAINHDPEAVAMHKINHPQTHHLLEDVFDVDPVKETRGRPVGLAWFSPDCKDFSKAKGGLPRSKKIRGLAWVMLKWTALLGARAPRVMVLENVEEFQGWGPLLGDNSRCPKRAGETFRAFIAMLTTGCPAKHPAMKEVREVLGKKFPYDKLVRGLGYKAEWKELRACDYGAPTIRKRLILIARRDGAPIVWPNPTHGNPKSEEVRTGKLKPWRVAAECIDWSMPCPSIFLSKEEARLLRIKRPLAEATQKRVARGIRKFVIDASDPFIIRVAHGEIGINGVKRWGDGAHSLNDPLGAIPASNEFALASPFVAPLTHQGSDRVNDIREPMRTITGAHRGETALVAPHITKFRTGATGSAADDPLHTITSGPKDNPAGAAHALGLVATHLTKFHGEKHDGETRGLFPDEPLHTQPTENRFGVVEAALEPAGIPFITEHANASSQRNMPVAEPLRTQCGEVKGGHFAAVTAFLAKHYGGVIGSDAKEPLHTITSTDHNAVVAAQVVGCGGRAGQSRPRNADEPLQTLTSKADSCLVASNLVRHFGKSAGSDIEKPAPTIPAGGQGKTSLVTSHLAKMYHRTPGHDNREPMHTITSTGQHIAEVRAFLIKYYGQGGQDQSCKDPMHTISTKHRMGLVTIQGEDYVITDIGMRMLQPRELFLAQGFPSTYVIMFKIWKKRRNKMVEVWIPKDAQVRMVGNSVSPPLAKAIVAANVPEMAVFSPEERRLRAIAA